MSVIGAHVRVTTLLDHTVLGRIHTIDSNANVLVVLEDNTNNLRILKTSFVKEVTALEKPRHTQDIVDLFGYVSLKDAQRREAQAVTQAALEADMRTRGISPEGRTVFEVLVRTLPCRWHGQSIIVMDEVRVDPPYTAENCRVDDVEKSKRSLDLVQKIVQGALERKGG